MRLIFIRHAEPDYAHNTITEKGWKEARLLAPRVQQWDVTRFYCSPLGRARHTSQPSLEACRRNAVILDWLQEFPVEAYNVVNRRTATCWDMYPEVWTEQPELYSKDRWTEAPLLRGTAAEAEFARVSGGLDALLASYGYHRHHNYYHVDDIAARDATLVCFCHLGVSCVMLGYLLGISPMVLLHGLFIPASSVTVVQTEERIPGCAAFRAQTIGDTAHLYVGREPVSVMASFTEPFQDREYGYHFTRDTLPTW